MTPKEKAKELISIYWKTKIETPHVREYIMSKELAKQCALIAVDEIYNEIDDNYDTLHSSDRKQYWQEVKTEIEKL
jgi:hypothetical protein